MGEDKGYRATIEKEILSGIGKVDVALEKDGRSIACEISITSDVEHELGNIQKCIASGFERIVLISSDRKVLNNASKLASTELNEQDRARVQFLSPEDFFTFMDEQEAMSAGTEQRIKGYKVRTTYKAIDEAEKRARKKVITQTILTALRKRQSS